MIGQRPLPREQNHLRQMQKLLALALLAPLTGCGENSIESYCSDLREHRKEMAEMIQSTSPGALLSHLLIWHGRRVCFARKPDCPGCVLNDVCPSAGIAGA